MMTHSTKVNVNIEVLKRIIEELDDKYLQVGATKETTEGRSAFCSWNNINKFKERLLNFEHAGTKFTGEHFAHINVVGEAKGNSARVYYTPSVTSLAKPFRKCIVPLNPDNQFLFFDLKAAEFFLAAHLAGETWVTERYKTGDDLYLDFVSCFPKGAQRKDIKTTVIASLYGVSAYRVGKTFGISESQGERVISAIARKIPAIEAFKSKVIMASRRANAYKAPKSLEKGAEWITISEVDPVKGFNESSALSASIQSALGFWMQSIIGDVSEFSTGTLLSVFDSMLIEIGKDSESVEKAKTYLSERILPFKLGKFGVADNFYDAQLAAE